MSHSETSQQQDSPKNKAIELLPEHLIDQIKAGEVVERPASLIKEIVENAIDAESTEIHLHIVNNGMDLISIEDNGQGMGMEDLPLAFARHATSKIRRFEDLYSLHSFGFRGEALASIASTARVTCSSTPADSSKKGGKIVYHGGQQVSLSPWQGHGQGTSMMIKDLFFNTPARLKFVKSQQSEKNAIKRILSSFILANPRVTFTIKWDDKDKEFYPALESSDPKSMEERVRKVLFTKKSENPELLYFEGEYEGHRAQGYISHTSNRSPAGKSQFLFANRRVFQDKGLHKAMTNTCEKLWGPGEIGHYCVMLQVPADQIDVNVHPNKTQIKFLSSGVLFSTLTSSLKKRIQEELKKNPPPEEKNHSEQNENSPVTQQNGPQSETNQWENFRSVYESDDRPSDLQDPFHYLEKRSSSGPLTLRDQISQEYLLIYHRDKESHYLCHLPNLALKFWKDLFGKAPFSEDYTSPLLISEPIYAESISKPTLNLFKTLGFELERVDNNTFALRSVPAPIQTLPITRFITPMIKASLSREKAPQTIDELLNHLKSSPRDLTPQNLSPRDFETLMEKLSFIELPENIIKELTQDKLDRLFEK